MKIQQASPQVQFPRSLKASAPAETTPTSTSDSVQMNSQPGSQGNRLNVFTETLKGAALFGLPAAFGAAEGAVLGKAIGTLAILPNAGLGATVGMAAGAVHGYREATEGRPKTEDGLNPAGYPRAALYGFFGGIGGAVGGAVLPLAGIYGGVTGALVMTGAGAAAGAYFAIKHNRQLES